MSSESVDRDELTRAVALYRREGYVCTYEYIVVLAGRLNMTINQALNINRVQPKQTP